ncbi:DUF4190 domain-containing protein [Micromonospora sp. RTP1Z1]|uniref:DUF4190 domain-containing protein n=1 Tax=Micromonospora sp. RTP1Z1 TaxID=2994043 RepID=UPI0029C6FEC2|nr:DUF4190 domain-containing protein [Micromonospora sp. RTP1Z1]
MSYPPPTGGWHDPSVPGQQSTPPADPTLPMGGQIPTQPTPAHPYAPTNPYAGTPGGQPTADPYAAAGYPPPAYPGYGYPGYGYPAAAKTNTMAIVALVLSLVGIASCITAPVGAILGHVARKQIRETGEQGEGMAKAAIIVGWILTGLLVLVIAFYVVVIALAISNGNTSSSSF